MCLCLSMRSLFLGVLAVTTLVVQAENTTTWTFTGLSDVSFIPQYEDNQNIHLSLKFRTQQPNGLLFYHYITSYDSKKFPLLKSYELFAELRQGYVRVGNNFNQFSDVIPIGSALNNDKWHSLEVKLEPKSGELTVTLDEKKQAKILEAFQRGGAEDLLKWSEIESRIAFGGTTQHSPVEFFYFVGCLSNIQYATGDGVLTNAVMEDVNGASQGCSDLCKGDNPCQNGGRCINLYADTRCDCFGTQFEGDLCNIKGPTVMTFRGYEWITYQLYEKKEDRLVADKSRFSFDFKTERASGVLMYAVGGTPYHSHVTASLHVGELHVSIAIADTDLEFTLGLMLDNGRWHNVTIIHSVRDVEVYLDGTRHHKLITGTQHFMTLDPKVYFGGGHNFVETRGLRVTQSFVGCLRNVFFNDISILYGLRKGNSQCAYNGGPTPEFMCDPTQEIPITFPTASSMLRHNSIMEKNMTVSLKFRTVRRHGLLFYVELISRKESSGVYDFGFIEVWIRDGLPLLYFSPSDDDERVQNLTLPSLVNNGQWHSLKLTLRDSKVKINVNGATRTTKRYRQTLTQRGKMVLGYGLRRYESTEGFVGCMKAITLQEKKLDPITLIDSSAAVGLKLDGCHLKDHCANNNICEHGSECLSDWDGVQCSCPEHYKGKACHFSKYPLNCNRYFQSGRNESGVYLIDVDGSGNLDPVYVQCDMNQVHGGHVYGDTVIDHNFSENTTIRNRNMHDVRYHLSYRHMDQEYLRALTKLSGGCYQQVRYRCHKAPLLLGKKTWFQATNGEIVDYIGSEKSGYCNCNGETCSGWKCYCDHSETGWKTDSGLNSVKNQLPLVDITVLQNEPEYLEGEGYLTLGPLHCWGNVDEPLDKSVTLTQEKSFIKLQEPWKQGNLQFSFKTHQTSALLLFQNNTEKNQNKFSVKIVNAHQVNFYFYINQEEVSRTLYTQKTLGGDDWHTIELDSDPYNIRISLDDSQELVDVPDSSHGVQLQFDGMLYLGGIPEMFAEKLGQTTPGFTGCLRGIVYNGAFHDLEKLIDISVGGMSVGCRSSCWPNPCANGGTCEESWGSYKCNCEDRWSHHGINCEHDINQDAVTFSGVSVDNSFLLYDMMSHPEILTKTIVFSFRTFQTEALLLYAHDHLNNFVQLSLTDSDTVTIVFNTYKTIIRESITLNNKFLNDGKWKQVIAEDFYNLTRLEIENVTKVIQVNRHRLDTYENQPFANSQEKEDVFIQRPPEEPNPFVHLYVGGVIDGVSFIPPLKGCIRGLKMADVIINLGSKAVEKGNTSVYPECEAGCHENACFKKGHCEESWKDSEFECDCSDTDMAGTRCEIEPCVNVDGNTFVKNSFTLHPNNLHTRSEQLSLTFKTRQRKFSGDDDSLLAMIYVRSSLSKDYVIAWFEPGISDRSSVVIETNQAVGIYRMKVTGNFANGQPHEMVYKRAVSEMYLTVSPLDKNGHLIIDGIKEAKFGFPDFNLDDIDTIFIGGVGNTSDLSGIRYRLVNFTGTISNVIFKPKSGSDEKVVPLKSLYNKENGTYVFGDPLGPCSGSLLTEAYVTSSTDAPRITLKPHERLTMPPYDMGPVGVEIIGNRIVPTTTPLPTTTQFVPITNLTAPVLQSHIVDDLTVAIAVSIIAALLIMAIIIALLLCRQRKRQEYDIKKEHDLELKQPLQQNAYVKPNPSPVPPDHLAKLDEFSMVSATLGPRPAKRVPPPEVPNRFSHGSLPLVDDEYPNVIFSRKKKRPASSISEVLEEMERRQKAKDQGLDPDAESPVKFEDRNHGEGELDWDPTADTTPLTCGDITFFNSPLLLSIPDETEEHSNPSPCSSKENPEDAEKSPDDSAHQTSTEYNGDSGYEAESRPENTEEDATPDSTVDIHTPPKMYMYDLTSLDIQDSPSLSDPSRRLLSSELGT